MKTTHTVEIAALLAALLVPAAPLACDEHAKDAEHACSHAKTGTVTAGDASAKGRRIVIPIAGMHCSMCAQRVTAALADVAGVRFVETSLDARRAVVVYDRSKAKPEALATAVKGAGYEPGKPRAN
ncbi:MAG TPA: heavy-metal-associated domain-containing protein [Anaeromyxobacter sp.]